MTTTTTVMGTEERPDVRLRRWLDAEYELGQHHGRPVALLRTRGDGPIFLDDRNGMAAWRYDLLHRHAIVPWWGTLDAAAREELVTTETGRLAAEAAEYGAELRSLTGEDVALVDLADSRGWNRVEFARRHRDWSMNRASARLDEQQETARTMAAATEGFAWTNLADDWEVDPPVPDRLARTDGQCGLYAAQRNLVVGYTESGKTWMELHALAQEIREARPVVLLDFENGEAVIRSRLRMLGLEQAQVKTLLRYAFLTAPLSPEFAGEMARELYGLGARLVLVDALTPVASAMGLDLSGGNVNAVEEVYATVLDPWVRVGFCATMLDNTGKRDRAATSGSQHKDAGVGGSVLAVVAEAKSARGRAGRSEIYLNKDRSGSVHHGLAAEDRRLFATMHVEPTGDDAVAVFLTPPPEEPDPIEELGETADRIVATLLLAAETLRRQGVTGISSMRQLVDWMDLVRPLDPAFEPAHTNRIYVTDVLFNTSSEPDRTAAGIRCRKDSYRIKTGAVRTTYRVELL